MTIINKQALAEQDLANIWLYTWHEWGEQQADFYLDELERAIKLLADQPMLGRQREELGSSVCIFYHAHHLLVYRVIKGGISIVRVLHKNMDVDMQIDLTP